MIRYAILFCLLPLLFSCNSIPLTNELILNCPLVNGEGYKGAGVIVYSEDREGSSVPQTFILTAAHLVDSSVDPNIEVYIPTHSDPISASLIAIDTIQDLALIKLQCDKLFPTLELTPENETVYVGERILTIGYPDLIGPILTEGFLCSKNHIIDDVNHYIASANVYYGNSGGPTVLFKNGKLLGILSRVRGGAPNYIIPQINCLVPYTAIWEFYRSFKLNFLLNDDNTPTEYFKSVRKF